MESVISFFGLIACSIGSVFSGGRMPNTDADTGLDYSPTPSAEELKAAALKYNHHGDW